MYTLIDVYMYVYNTYIYSVYVNFPKPQPLSGSTFIDEIRDAFSLLR